MSALGAAVAVADIDSEAVASTVEALASTGGTARACPVDLADLNSLDAWLGGVQRAMGLPDILVNCAGITGTNLLDTSLDDWARVMAVNLTAPFVLIRWIGRCLIESGSSGSIVNVSSSSAFRAVSSGGAYGVSKAGIAALARGAAWELGPHGINVNTVVPGVTRSGITSRAFPGVGDLEAAVLSGPLANLLGRVSEAEDVANVIVFLCLPASRQITGQVVHTSAGAVV
jgi:NAD(P)-dependent dehydrogenase (short-subunit alcohol dehydrogenase family)